MLLALTCFLVLFLVAGALQPRPLVAAIVGAVATIALRPYLESLDVESLVSWGLGLAAALVLLPYAVGPVLTHASRPMSAAPRVEPYDASLHRTPDSIVTAVRATTESLVAAGFAHLADLVVQDHIAGMSTHVALLEKRSTGQQAMCAATWKASLPAPMVAADVELMASFSDGRILLANNSAIIGAFGPVAGRTLEQFPTVRDPAGIAVIHERLIDRARGEASLATRDRSQEVPAYVAGLMVREMEQQVACGYLRLDGPASVYRPTWRGAALMCWKLLPPVSTLRRARIRRREARLLADFAAGGIGVAPLVIQAEPASVATRRLSWAGVVAIGMIAAYFAGADTAPAGALEPPAPPSFVPADFDVPNDFPGAVRALERLARATASPLVVRDSLGVRVKASGASIAIRAALADSIIAGAQQRFLERGFFLFRHEPNYDLNGRPDEVALVPMWDHYRVVKLVGTNGASFDITNAQVITWLQALEHDAPFVLTGIGYDHIEGRFTGRVADPDAMAQRLYKFCPDVVDQGTGSVTTLAAELRRLNTFHCWWD